MRLGHRLGLCGISWLGCAALAAVPTYNDFELECRANFGSAYNLPPATFFTSNTPVLNDSAAVAIKLTNLPNTLKQGIWFGGGGTGSIVFESLEDAGLSTPGLNNAGVLVMEQSFSSANGLYTYNTVTHTGGILTTQPLGASGWGSPQINNSGQVGYRASFLGAYAWVSYAGTVPVAYHAVDASVDPQSPYSYLFTPSFNNARQIAGKVRRGAAGQVGESQPDQIRIFNADGSSVLCVQDQNSDPNAPFTGFDNSVALTNSGKVAFIATLPGNVRGVFLYDGGVVKTIATPASPLVSSIEFFGPAANDAGLVAFRGFDEAGLRAIFVGDGTTLVRVIGEHDLVPTDLGTARIDQHDSSPVFGGGVSINARGDIAFNAGLTPPDNNQVEWGSGVFIAYARLAHPGDLNCDGAVNFKDINPFVEALGYAPDGAGWPYACPWLNADCNNDGVVNFKDINAFVALLGT